MKKFYLLLSLILHSVTFSNAGKIPAVQAGNCPSTTAQLDLAVNNVRAHLLVGGDLWWNPSFVSTGIYEVPIGSGKNAIYAGALWMGGIDPSGQILVAAQTYRQSGGNDFWAGPISKDINGVLSITNARCNQFDRFWTINKSDVQSFATGGTATADMMSWPGNGDVGNGELPFLAPFFDANNDGIYNYLDGDYPYYNLGNNYPVNAGTGASVCNNYLLGDQVNWWVFNDIGNIKTETNSAPIGVEVRAQAFAYASTINSINNTTFYKYEIINRSNDSLNDAYVGTWCDFDLGNAIDDYVGSDVSVNMGYCYNGKDTDAVYGPNPPAIGIKVLQGPYVDGADGIDNNRNNIIDEPGEDWGLSKFVYYTNSNGAPTGNPAVTDDYYNYLSGEWLDGQQITYGGNGRGAGVGATSTPCNYMFPENTDPSFSTSWTMPAAGIAPDDMRALLSEGKFSMAPGSVNYLTNAVIFQQASSGGRFASLALLKQAAIDMQNYFNSCFTNVTSIKDLANNNDVTAFPNPFNDNVSIAIPGLHSNDFTMQLFDAAGKLISINYSLVADKIIIDNKNLAAGTYVVSVKLNSGKRYTKKIVRL